MTAAPTEAADLTAQVSKVRADLAALLDRVRVLAGALDHVAVPAAAETACAHTVYYLESGTSWGRLRGDWRGIGCSAEAGVPAVEGIGELLVEDL